MVHLHITGFSNCKPDMEMWVLLCTFLCVYTFLQPISHLVLVHQIQIVVNLCRRSHDHRRHTKNGTLNHNVI